VLGNGALVVHEQLCDGVELHRGTQQSTDRGIRDCEARAAQAIDRGRLGAVEGEKPAAAEVVETRHQWHRCASVKHRSVPPDAGQRNAVDLRIPSGAGVAATGS